MQVEVMLPPQKRPYGSPLYKVSRDTYDIVDPRGDLMVEAGQPTSRDYVVVQDSDFNDWARALFRADDGYLYYYSPAKYVDGVNTRISVTAVQHYMLRNDFPNAKVTEDANMSYESIQDFVATMRSAAAPTMSKFWFPSTKIRFLQTFTVGLHHAHPGQYLSLENAAPEPAWVQQYLQPAGSQTAESGLQREREEGTYLQPNWGYWDHENLMTVYHGTYPTCLPSIIHDGFARSFGAGCMAMKAIFGIPVSGVYTSDRIGTAFSYPQTWGAGGPDQTRGAKPFGA